MEKVYLIGKEDGFWSAVVDERAPNDKAVEFVAEGTYPVQVYYSRTDINGSGVYEMDECASREDLVRSLNFIGECGAVVRSLWDYDINKTLSENVWAIFEKGLATREKIAQEWVDDLMDVDVNINQVVLNCEKIDVAIERAKMELQNQEFCENFGQDYVRAIRDKFGVGLDYSLEGKMQMAKLDAFESWCSNYSPTKRAAPSREHEK